MIHFNQFYLQFTKGLFKRSEYLHLKFCHLNIFFLFSEQFNRNFTIFKNESIRIIMIIPIVNYKKFEIILIIIY